MLLEPCFVGSLTSVREAEAADRYLAPMPRLQASPGAGDSVAKSPVAPGFQPSRHLLLCAFEIDAA